MSVFEISRLDCTVYDSVSTIGVVHIVRFV